MKGGIAAFSVPGGSHSEVGDLGGVRIVVL